MNCGNVIVRRCTALWVTPILQGDSPGEQRRPGREKEADRTMATTIHDALVRAARRLEQAGVDTPRLDAEVLLRHVLGVDRTRLFMMYPEPIPEDAAHSFDDLLERREGGEPVAYLTGMREFMALSFITEPGVLIPRPDTEPLVEWALAWLDHRPDAVVVDIGTGSGAIAVSIVAHTQSSFQGKVIAVDVSADALAIAERNANNVLSGDQRSRLTFVRGSLTEPLGSPVDLLLANLPYLTPDQIAENPALQAEPRLALDGGADGLDLVRAVIADLPRVLAPGGAAGFEIDPSQVSETERLLRSTFPAAKIDVISDLAGRQRHVTMQLPHDNGRAM
jgi:release factor glutamine methyltransferase